MQVNRQTQTQTLQYNVERVNLYFFTNSYPYHGEAFVANEVNGLANFYGRVFIFPTVKSDSLFYDLPRNAEVVHPKLSFTKKIALLMSNAFLVMRIFSLDLYHNKEKWAVVRKLRYNLSLVLKILGLVEAVGKKISEDPDKKVFISFWMDDWALCLSILKYNKKINHFVFRVHQHDLFHDKNPLGYIPFRFFNIKMASEVLPDSVRGVEFLRKFEYYPEKVKVGHLGVEERGTNPFDPTRIVLVSCASLVSRKRVEFIADVLMDVKSEVNWIHFGRRGDSPDSFEKLQKKCELLPPNIKWELKGDVSNNQLIEFYRTTPVSCFITLTRAEGLPVSIIEAISFGIPVLATDIMGIKDIVTAETGVLLSEDPNKSAVALIIESLKSSALNTHGFRAGVKSFWRQHFNSDTIYRNFSEHVNKNYLS
jgi:glycosyltransferase involved in cell wall biosynthesis